ncbi:Late embryogenesis abundant protein LEA_2 subgroup [Arabidopsis thaliana x Arabidopsis arenosa]|uniref:Late embryogenesis abundant protein LEA_2 subgroup n=1 Tax=Arabidopsis thaliana x Arabidopsis arenosa TaxID=1240361 RepID=A0A8T1YYE2_9BRAS|nr:Late embryogenesis abundant protein LEA_2 subgroup [Arabidopsis thaliana x Arabidopsis arenosa]
MTGRDCNQHYDYEERRMRRIVWGGLLGLIVAVAFVVFLVWAILHPHGPRFVLQDVTINDFNISQPNFLSSNLQVTLSSRNPNDKIGIFYDRLDIYATYRNQEVTVARLLPSTYQGHLEATVWSPFLIGSNVPVAPYLSPALNEDLIAGMVLLNIKIDGWVRWKVGSWISGGYHLHVNCPAFITVTGKLVGPGPAIKYQLVQRCAVDLS